MVTPLAHYRKAEFHCCVEIKVNQSKSVEIKVEIKVSDGDLRESSPALQSVWRGWEGEGLKEKTTMYPCIKCIKCILVKAGKVVWQMANLKILTCVAISLKRGERIGLIGVKGKTTMYPSQSNCGKGCMENGKPYTSTSEERWEGDEGLSWLGKEGKITVCPCHQNICIHINLVYINLV